MLSCKTKNQRFVCKSLIMISFAIFRVNCKDNLFWRLLKIYLSFFTKSQSTIWNGKCDCWNHKNNGFVRSGIYNFCPFWKLATSCGKTMSKIENSHVESHFPLINLFAHNGKWQRNNGCPTNTGHCYHYIIHNHCGAEENDTCVA